MQYRQEWMSRIGLGLLVTAVGCWSAGSAEAAGYGNGSSAAAAPQGPIFKTLDALAGGIETVLQRTVLAHRKPSSCGAIGCDDSCDHLTLRQFAEPAMPGRFDQPIPLHHPAESAMQFESATRLPSEPSFAVEPGFPAGPTAPATGDLPAAPSFPAAPTLPRVPDFPAEPRVQAEPSFPAVSKVQPPPRIPAELSLQAEPEKQPQSLVKRVPAALPELSLDQPSEPTTLSTEDGWINSFSPSPPVAPRSQHRADALSDPFLDDSPSGL